jgi:intracellular sulfur oxidation DsrE/DsrF family protein
LEWCPKLEAVLTIHKQQVEIDPTSSYASTQFGVRSGRRSAGISILAAPDHSPFDRSMEGHMSNEITRAPVARRSFLSRFGISIAALGATAGATLPAMAQQARGTAFQPTRHPMDDWMDQPAGKHRFVFDSTTPDAAGAALLYANNFFTANKAAYNLDPPDLPIIIVMRHFSTPFAYNNTIWGKYGKQFSEAVHFTDPKTKQAPSTNLYNSADYGLALPNFGTTLDSLAQKRVQFAVCDMATHFFAGMLADQTKGNADAIYRELVANVIPNSHMVPAGIVAVNRAQERGYTFSYAT